MRFKILLILLVSIPFFIQTDQTGGAQTSTCPDIVETALDAIDEFCADTGRNQACYGNLRLEAEPRGNVSDFSFENVGDIADVTDIQRLRLRSMDVAQDEWGVALLRLQANLPDTLPGQNVTFILFGDVEITNAVDDPDSQTPMQAFYLRTGIGDSQCAEAPDSGLLVQTPEGVGEVAFTVNDVEVQMGSTVLFQAEAGDEMTVTTIEGSAAIRRGERVLPVVAGTLARLRLSDNLSVESLPDLVEAYQEDDIRGLPLRVLSRRIIAQTPLTPRQMRVIMRRLQNGQPLCGDAPLPSCDRLPAIAGGTPCVLPSRVDQLSEEERANRPVCDADAMREGAEELRQRVENVCECTFTPTEDDPRPVCNDNLRLWTVTIAEAMQNAAPPEVVGENLNLLLRGDGDFDPTAFCGGNVDGFDFQLPDRRDSGDIVPTTVPEVDEVQNEIEDAVDDARDDVNDGVNDVDDAVDDARDDVDDAVDDTRGTIDDIRDNIDDGVDEPGGTVDDIRDNVPDDDDTRDNGDETPTRDPGG